MPRSYFSRVARGGNGLGIQPPRPVTALWKSARLEWLASSPASPAGAPQPLEDVAATPPAPAVRDRPRGLRNPLHPGDLEATVGGPGQRLHEANPSRIAPVSPSTHQLHSDRIQPPQRLDSWIDAGSSARPNRRIPTPTDPAQKYRKSHSRMTVSMTKRSELVPSVAAGEPALVQPLKSAASSDAGEHRLTDARVPDRPVSRGTLPALEPWELERSSSLRHRETASSQEPRPQPQSAPQQTNKVEIGRLEVQVIAPPPLPGVQRAPMAKARLARGYAIWPGWW